MRGRRPGCRPGRGGAAAVRLIRSASVPVVSPLTGRIASDELATAGPWVRQARQTVRFADAVGVPAEEGVTAFVEAGPAPSSGVIAEECVGPNAGAVFPSCGDAGTTVEALAALQVHGVAVHWRSVYADTGARRRAAPVIPCWASRCPTRTGPGSGTRPSSPSTAGSGWPAT